MVQDTTRFFKLGTGILEIIVVDDEPFSRSSLAIKGKGQLLHYRVTWMRGWSMKDKPLLDELPVTCLSIYEDTSA